MSAPVAGVDGERSRGPGRGGGEADPGPTRFAIGVGFRKCCSAEALATLVNDALARLGAIDPTIAAGAAVLATIAEKDRPVLREAAEMLGLDVTVLPKSALHGTENRITVGSDIVRACFGIPSVAEAAALAAAGPGARLIVTRLASKEATCAIAATDPGLAMPDLP